MATTIQVASATLDALRALKEASGAASYDDVVRRLLMDHRKRTVRLVGLTPGIGPFERDHGDRD